MPTHQGDTSRPLVNFTFPQPGASQVAVNAKLAVTFSELMDPASLNSGSFSLTGPDAQPVAGFVTYAGSVATFTPSAQLQANSTYTATIGTGARDLAGNPLSVAQQWSFVTGTTADTSAPRESYSNPANGATSVAVNTKLAVTFNEVLDPLSLNTQSFRLSGPDGLVAGQVTYAGNIATFTPDHNLDANSTYTARLSSEVRDLAGNALAERTWTFRTGSSGSSGSSGSGSSGTPLDGNPPKVKSFNPADEAIAIPLNAKIVAVFNEAMDPILLLSAFTLTGPGGAVVDGTVSYVGNVATFTPDELLDASTTYTVTISQDAEDLAGNQLAASRIWSFTSGTTADLTRPVVSASNPVDGAEAVALNGQIAISFSEAMDPVSLNPETITMTGPGGSVAGTVTYAGNIATFTPESQLTSNSTYTMTIGTGVMDLTGNTLATPEIWSFTTGIVTDTSRPLVSSTSPTSGGQGVALNGQIAATFSEAMDPSSLGPENFTVTGPGGAPVEGTLSFAGNGTVVIFIPGNDFAAATTYRATISTVAQDLAGNALANEKTWSFTTGNDQALGPAPVQLGTAANYVILSKSGISTVPNSVITGDIGVSPIDLTAVTQFSYTLHSSGRYATSSQVTGRIYAANLAVPTPITLTTAVSDMETAYTDAAGRLIPDFVNFNAGEIGGQILVPGLYTWGTGVNISTNVTISGGPNDVWIFQISGNLTQSTGTIVTLSGGALPEHIFWQITGAANLEANSQFKGIVLSQTGIHLSTGAVVKGRLLAQTAVTLQKSTVTQP